MGWGREPGRPLRRAGGGIDGVAEGVDAEAGETDADKTQCE
jgi:hypothetical protein